MKNAETYIERIFPMLIAGDRDSTREIVQEARDEGATWEEISQFVYWPLHEEIDRLYRADQLTALAHHFAARVLRLLVSQAQAGYEQQASRGRKIMVFCGEAESDELGAQLVTDLIEADGYEVRLGGGGIANDEILGEVGDYAPDVLMLFSSAAQDAPRIRQLIDHVREVNAWPDMQFAVGGGIFNRAPGLAQEIGADIWAVDPTEMLEVLVTKRGRIAPPEQRTVGKRRKRAAA